MFIYICLLTWFQINKLGICLFTWFQQAIRLNVLLQHAFIYVISTSYQGKFSTLTSYPVEFYAITKFYVISTSAHLICTFIIPVYT